MGEDEPVFFVKVDRANHHLRNVVQEMDSVIYEAKVMVMQANQPFP